MQHSSHSTSSFLTLNTKHTHTYKIWHVNMHIQPCMEYGNCTQFTTSVCSHLTTRECSKKERVPRVEHPTYVGSCGTHKYSRSVCLKLVRVASATTYMMCELQTKLTILRTLRSLRYVMDVGMQACIMCATTLWMVLILYTCSRLWYL